MYYIIFTTTLGTVDLGKLGTFYSTLEEAEAMAERLMSCDFMVNVTIKKQ